MFAGHSTAAAISVDMVASSHRYTSPEGIPGFCPDLIIAAYALPKLSLKKEAIVLAGIFF